MNKTFLNRPRLHFTPAYGYMNDPNGLVYDRKKDVYHVCFQYQKNPRCDLNVCWRHALGKDLCELEEKGTVIYPCDGGVAFSGCSVIDEKNCSRLFSEPGTNILSFFTVHNLETKHEYIAAAYSQDGRNWQVLNRPVIENANDEYGVNGFRDPKVIWTEQFNKWLMITGGGKARLFASENLLDWEYQSTVMNVPAADASIISELLVLQKYLPENDPYAKELITECPDLFPLSTQTGNIKWILSGGGLFYVVGDLKEDDGKIVFSPVSLRQTFMQCSDFFSHRGEPYALQTFADGRTDRRLSFSWLMDDTAFEISEKPYNGVLSLPHELKLVKKEDTYVVCIYPIKELEKYRETLLWKGMIETGKVLSEKKVGLFEILLDFDCSKTDSFEILCENEDNVLRFLFRTEEKRMYIDLTGADSYLKHKVHVMELNKCNVVRIIKDTSVLDIYVNEGARWYSVFTFHTDSNFYVSVRPTGSRMKIRNLEMYCLKSIYSTE